MMNDHIPWKSFSLLLSILFLFGVTHGQSLTETRFSMPKPMLSVICDSAELALSLEEARNTIENELIDRLPAQVYLRVSIGTGQPKVELYHRSESESTFDKLRKKIEKIKWPKSSFPFEIEMLSSYNSNDLPVSTAFNSNPSPLKRSPNFEIAKPTECINALEYWYWEVVLPFAVKELETDTSQSALLNFGYVLESRIRYKESFDPLLYTTNSSRFWRALIESEDPVDLLLIASAIHGVNKEYERAIDYVLLADQFDHSEVQEYLIATTVAFYTHYINQTREMIPSELSVMSPYDPTVLKVDSNSISLLKRFAPLFINESSKFDLDQMKLIVAKDDVQSLLSKPQPDLIEWTLLIDACYIIDYNELGCAAAWMVFQETKDKALNLRFVQGLIRLNHKDIYSLYPSSIVQKAKGLN